MSTIHGTVNGKKKNKRSLDNEMIIKNNDVAKYEELRQRNGKWL